MGKETVTQELRTSSRTACACARAFVNSRVRRPRPSRRVSRVVTEGAGFAAFAVAASGSGQRPRLMEV